MTTVDTRRVVLITGVRGGIGSAAAHAFAADGWRVVGLDRDAGPSASEFLFEVADVAIEEQNAAALARVAAEVGRIDALVNNAGIQIRKNLVTTTSAEWDAVMDANLRATYLTIRHAYPLLAEHNGAIVNVSSVHAMASSRGNALYAASKGAIVALTRALAVEAAPDGVRVNSVLPGAVDTPMLRAGLPGATGGAHIERELGTLAGRHIVGRVGRPDEIARAILFLADNQQSAFVTGQTLVVDGGALARLSTE